MSVKPGTFNVWMEIRLLLFLHPHRFPECSKIESTSQAESMWLFYGAPAVIS